MSIFSCLSHLLYLIYGHTVQNGKNTGEKQQVYHTLGHEAAELNDSFGRHFYYFIFSHLSRAEGAGNMRTSFIRRGTSLPWKRKLVSSKLLMKMYHCREDILPKQYCLCCRKRLKLEPEHSQLCIDIHFKMLYHVLGGESRLLAVLWNTLAVIGSGESPQCWVFLRTPF